MIFKTRLKCACSALALSVALAPAYATGAEDAPGEDKGFVFEEITVTAQRREENLQDISVAATALTASALRGKSVDQVSDLQFAVPSLSITDAGLTQSVNIRGIGLASGSPNAANGVATYVDGLFQPPIITMNSFYDVGSVEVFRGPQGTFVGSNSTGGAIFVNSRNPDFDNVNGYGEASVGNYGAYGFEGAMNLPVSDTLAIRGAVNYQQRDSYFTDIGPEQNEPDSLDEIAGRIGVLWRPDDSFQALLKVEALNKKTGGYAYAPIVGTAYSAFRQDDIRTLNYDSPTKNDEDAVQASLELRYETSGGTTFRSLSGYQDKEINNLYDIDATSAATLPQSSRTQFVREQVWTEELNVISATDTDLSWIVGGYFQRNKINVHNKRINDGFPVDVDLVNWKTTTGIFGQVTYHVSDKFTVDAGVRYSHYKVTGIGDVRIGTGIPGFPPEGVPVADLAGEHTDGKATGKLALNWTPDDNHLIYAFVTRGYKAGGFVSQTLEFDPETVIDYELGWKGSLLDDHLRAQVSAFYYDYSDFQFDVLDVNTGQTDVTNLTDATVKGVEAEVQAQFDGLRIDAGVSYVDSSLGDATFIDLRAFARDFPGATATPECPGGGPSNPPACFNYTPYLSNTGGGPNLFSPKWSYNIGVEYRHEMGDITITPRVNYAYIGEQYTYIGYSEISDRLEARGILSAFLTLQTGEYQLEFYGSNLADKEYVSGQIEEGNEFYGAPREFGARLRIDF